MNTSSTGMTSGYIPTLQEVQRTQLTRLDIVNLLQEPNLREVIESCFVRVLLEIETGNEDYRIFTIKDIGHGAVYRGFSSDPNAQTDIYIDLNLPNDLRGINGTAFQLNSVSNSRITQSEYNAWTQSPGPLPGDTSVRVQGRIARLLQHPIIGPRRQNMGPPPAAPPAAASVQHSINASATTMNPGATSAPRPRPAPQLMATVTASSSSRSQMPDVLTTEAATRAVMEELRDKNVVFVDPDFAGHTTTLLRTAERDVSDYLEKLRELMSQHRQTCVVCMDRPPTVVTLPCKHKVLCRLCASQVNSCPCCRETAVEVFEPIEP
mmetsp:Transcript_7982/g.24890  ORF Transcript_7982/g.24890 Transcript_7982/m.24890 type:complete len:322 (-) Transcript_7982:217-1182(-)